MGRKDGVRGKGEAGARHARAGRDEAMSVYCIVNKLKRFPRETG